MGEQHERWFFDEHRVRELWTDVTMSTCGGLEKPGNEISDEQFRVHLITYDRLKNDPDLLFDPNLVICLNGKNYDWRVAHPVLTVILMYQELLSASVLNALISDYHAKHATQQQQQATDPTAKSNVNKGIATKRSYFWWLLPASAQATKKESAGTKPKQVPSSDQPTVIPPNASAAGGRSTKSPRSEPFGQRGTVSESELDKETKSTAKPGYKKTLTSAELKSLNLNRNVPNKARFSITTKYRGTSVCECDVWLWHHTDTIVISDIDGTITRSDVLGHIIPRVISGSWSHTGVAKLFHQIVDNDYKILYLTARAVGMAGQTKRYLKSVRQGKFRLPDGPLLLSPTSIFAGLYWEVIAKKPEIFKKQCLLQVLCVASLFPRYPFYAGFENRDLEID